MTVAADSARYRMIYELGYAFATRTDLDELIPFVISKCREVLDSEGISLLLLDSTRNELYFPYFSDENPEVARRLGALRFPADRGVAGSVLRTGRGESVEDVSNDPRFYSEIDQQSGFTTRSILAAPLIGRESAIGVIEVVNRRGGGSFTEKHLELLEALAKSIAVAIENAQRFGQVKASEQRLRVQVGALRRDLARHDRFTEIIAVSPAMSDVFRLMETAAATSIPVLIEGQTGTGKELVARAIHRTSARADGPFLAINCAAVPETLLESELFGHRRGAFTGAIEDHPGLFRAAAGGAIFLDEIGEMPVPMQAKLLRVLQDGEVTALGDTRPQKLDVRVLSASNHDLKAAIAARTFREDLYYRLAVFPIKIPPLRERREDIPLMAARFLEVATRRHPKRVAGFDPATIDLLCRFDWPGNVRELQNEIERAVALAKDGETITPQHLSAELRAVSFSTPPHRVAKAAVSERASPAVPQAPRERTSLRDALGAYEAQHIAAVLAQHQGNVSRAAAALGISRISLHRRMQRYKLR